MSRYQIFQDKSNHSLHNHVIRPGGKKASKMINYKN